MASKSLYQRRIQEVEDDDNNFIVSKFDADMNFVEEYTIMRSHMDEWVCSCPARITLCRHVKMMEMFGRAERGEDPLFTEISGEGKYVTFLEFNGKMFNWIQGPEIGETDDV